MSTPLPLHSAPDSPTLTPSHKHHHVSPTPTSPPLNLPLHLNVITQQSLREPPHYSSLIGKALVLDKHTSVSVEEVIAEGGFGVIFLVKNSGDKVKYALKRVVVNSSRDYEGVLGEVAVMSHLSPKTPHLLGSLSHVIMHYPPCTFEVQNLMPLCKQNLLQIASQRMQRSAHFETPEILQILTHVSTGLEYLHSSSPPIIHRDIKIENVLSLDDTYVLSDFGSATVKYWDPQVDSIQAIQEDLDKNTTLQYRSPEMVDLYGGRGAISVASDIWALGVCGFKLMSFKDPFETILAIQNRNLNWSTTKSRYPDTLVLLIECLLAEHQSVRPTVDEVIKIATSAQSSDWAPIQSAYARIAEDKKSREEASVKKNTASQSANVVMETTVTPRQRPKRGLGSTPSAATTAVAPNTGVIIPPVIAPPKSPKPVSPSNAGAVAVGAGSGNLDNNARFFSPATPQSTTQTISPTQQPAAATPSPTPPQPPAQTTTPSSWTAVGGGGTVPPAGIVPPAAVATAAPPPSSGGSYNPFDDEPDTDSTAAAALVTNDDAEFDVFANAPFDYFKYQPIMMGAGHLHDEPSSGQELYHTQFQYHHHHPYSNYAPNNPFLYSSEQEYVLHSSSASANAATYDLSNNNAATTTTLSAGVCNLSFNDGLGPVANSNEHHHRHQQQQHVAANNTVVSSNVTSSDS